MRSLVRTEMNVGGEVLLDRWREKLLRQATRRRAGIREENQRVAEQRMWGYSMASKGCGLQVVV
jgi:hypothetical protein